jgi:hypothetical protein
VSRSSSLLHRCHGVLIQAHPKAAHQVDVLRQAVIVHVRPTITVSSTLFLRASLLYTGETEWITFGPGQNSEGNPPGSRSREAAEDPAARYRKFCFGAEGSGPG